MVNWGFDMGGTKIEGVVLSDTGEVLVRQRIPTEKEKGYQHILNQVCKLVDLMSDAYGSHPERIGLGTPGSIDPPTQLLKNSNTTAVNGMPFQKDLIDQLGIPVVMANDANCFAIAEARLGAVPDVVPLATVVFGVILGTGVGGGLVINGKVWNGAHGIGGEWGHNFMDASGGMCYCGQVGCVETILSGTGLERFYKQQSETYRKLPDIMQRYDAGIDPHATAMVERLLHYFGKGIASIINIIDPDAIVIGGGVGNIDLLYERGPEYVKKFLFNPRLDTPILKPKLGDSAGVFGAAMLVD